jgi:geranylgeranyl diphosphate synthase type II
MKMDVKEILEERKKFLEKKMEYFLSEQSSTLGESVRYSVMSGGKRFRPLLLLSIGESLGAPLEELIYPACAIEFIHTSTLIHDDLPALDNDDWRRGKPTNHKVFGEGVALLAGDFLIALAFSILSFFPERKSAEQIKLRAISILGEELKNLIKGQTFELLAKSPSEYEIIYLYLLKTGSLMSASAELAGVFAQVDEESISVLKNFGSNLGLAFQITDDLLDLFQDQRKNNSPFNYAYLYGHEIARTKAQYYRDKALEDLKKLGIKSPVVEYLVNLSTNREI